MNALSGPEGGAKPFTRVVTTPPALPWDQARAAHLEARHTSPISAGTTGQSLSIIVKRLEPWRPKAAGRFVAVYLRGATKGALSFDIDVQGRTVRVDIPSRVEQAELLRQRLWIGGTAAVIAVVLLAQIALTLHRRAEVETQLSTLEQQVERTARLASGTTKARQNAQALADMNLEGRTSEDVIEALRTVTTARDPAARIDSFLWEGGDWALEVRGQTPPLTAIDMQRAPKPVRPGVWLWVKPYEAEE